VKRRQQFFDVIMTIFHFLLVCLWCCFQFSSTIIALSLNSPNLDRVKCNLHRKQFVKLICGASNHDLSFVRNLCLIYTAAEVDCIDIGADPGVVHAAREGIYRGGYLFNRPLPSLMISISDGFDSHFRKAQFNKDFCPPNCPRPCEKVCPAFAIPPIKPEYDDKCGVLTNRCYGCNRCVVACPKKLISSTSFNIDKEIINNLLIDGLIDGVEIHTNFDHELLFAKLWNEIGDTVIEKAKILSVSLSDSKNSSDEELSFYLNNVERIIALHNCDGFKGIRIWQVDGRSMTGDLGINTAHSSIKFAKKLLRYCSENYNSRTKPPNILSNRHFVQVAGGTNMYSVGTAYKEGLYTYSGFGGYGFGGYARKHITAILLRLMEKSDSSSICVEDHQLEFEQCLAFANALVSSVRSSVLST